MGLFDSVMVECPTEADMLPPGPTVAANEAKRLTGEQRYWQARKLASLRAKRRLRDFMAGKIPILECSDPEPEIIRELDRAYAIGFADGQAAALSAASPTER